jgi:hypothetical protein
LDQTDTQYSDIKIKSYLLNSFIYSKSALD